MDLKNYHINSTVGIISVLIVAGIVGGIIWVTSGSLFNDISFGIFNRDKTNNEQEQEQEQEQEPQVSDSGNMIVSHPSPNDAVGLPLEVRGEARVFENTLNIRLLDEDGSVLAETFTTADAPDIGQFGTFSVSINYPEPQGATGTVEVFSQSARDGSEINMVRIPVTFSAISATDTMEVKLYFTTTATGAYNNSCEADQFVTRRIPQTQAVARAAIEELLKGPTYHEEEINFNTSINAGTQLQSLRIENGTAYADFNEALDHDTGGSCLVSAIYSQIANTLKQFPTVDDVVISVNGETEEVLQP